MTDTEGGSLNPDLRIREKGVPGNRTLSKEEYVLFLKSTIGLKNNLFPNYVCKICTTCGN